MDRVAIPPVPKLETSDSCAFGLFLPELLVFFLENSSAEYKNSKNNT